MFTGLVEDCGRVAEIKPQTAGILLVIDVGGTLLETGPEIRLVPHANRRQHRHQRLLSDRGRNGRQPLGLSSRDRNALQNQSRHTFQWATR